MALFLFGVCACVGVDSHRVWVYTRVIAANCKTRTRATTPQHLNHWQKAFFLKTFIQCKPESYEFCLDFGGCVLVSCAQSEFRFVFILYYSQNKTYRILLCWPILRSAYAVNKSMPNRFRFYILFFIFCFFFFFLLGELIHTVYLFMYHDWTAIDIK